MADELRRFAITDQGRSVWDVADADSGRLEAAYASLLDSEGQFREDEFESVADPVVYVYRFCLHPDFGRWKLPAIHAFCESFDMAAIILAQPQAPRKRKGVR